MSSEVSLCHDNSTCRHSFTKNQKKVKHTFFFSSVLLVWFKKLMLCRLLLLLLWLCIILSFFTLTHLVVAHKAKQTHLSNREKYNNIKQDNNNSTKGNLNVCTEVSWTNIIKEFLMGCVCVFWRKNGACGTKYLLIIFSLINKMGLNR